MAEHNDTGKQGETLAVEYLMNIGFEILHKNWRYHHHEIDLIASKGGILHFVEVKTRTSDKWGFPEDEVTIQKFKSIKTAASGYLYRYPTGKRVQFDILAIILQPKLNFLLIEDVYF